MKPTRVKTSSSPSHAPLTIHIICKKQIVVSISACRVFLLTTKQPSPHRLRAKTSSRQIDPSAHFYPSARLPFAASHSTSPSHSREPCCNVDQKPSLGRAACGCCAARSRLGSGCGRRFVGGREDQIGTRGFRGERARILLVRCGVWTAVRCIIC